MAATTQAAAGQANRFETFMWRFMRLSGVLLLPLAFGHLAIMHILNSVYVMNYEWVIVERWGSVLWRIYDAGLLWFAGIHGFNGLRIVINDYVHEPGLNRTLKVVLIGLIAIIFALGTIALIGAPFVPKDLGESIRLFLTV